MSNGDIEAPGHELWVPIPLDLGPEELYEQLLDRFGRDAATADNAAAMAGAARQLVEANAHAEETHSQNLAGWALVSAPSSLSVRAFATLRGATLDPGTTPREVVDQLTEGETLFEDPVLRPLETRSGDATSIRARPMVDVDGASRVHELTAVVWSRPELSAGYILSTYSTDLVEAREIGELLDELAASIAGL
jgi:hypothetical protein